MSRRHPFSDLPLPPAAFGLHSRIHADLLEKEIRRRGGVPGSTSPEAVGIVDPYRPHHPYNASGYMRTNYDTGRGGGFIRGTGKDGW